MLEAHHVISRLISPVTISRLRNWPRVQRRLNILNCRILNYFIQKPGIFQRQMALTTAHVSDTCSLCWSNFFQKLYAMSQV